MRPPKSVLGMLFFLTASGAWTWAQACTIVAIWEFQRREGASGCS